MGHPGQQRFVALADFVPIEPAHVWIPVEVALNPPGLAENLLPLRAGIDQDLQACGVQLALAYLGFARYRVHHTVSFASVVDHLVAVFVQIVVVDAFQQDLVFALGDFEDVQRVPGSRRARQAGLCRFDGDGAVEEFFLPGLEVVVDPRGNRRVHDTLADAVRVHLDRFGRLVLGLLLVSLFLIGLFFFRFVLALLFSARGGSGARLGFARGVFLLVLLALSIVLLLVVLLGGFLLLITLQSEGRRLVRLQGDGEDAGGAVIVEALIEAARTGIEKTLGEEIQVFAVVIEDRIGVVIKTVGDREDLLLLEGIEVDRAGQVRSRLCIGCPAAVRGPVTSLDVAVLSLIDLYRLLFLDVHVPQPQLLVPVEQLLIVGRP